MDPRELLRQRSRETAIEILSLFDRISRLTGRARGAATRAELETLAEVLDQRQHLFAEAAGQVRRLAALRREAPADEEASLAPVLARVRQVAGEVHRENEELASHLARHRDAVTESIARSNVAARAATAYRAVLRFPRLDLRH